MRKITIFRFDAGRMWRSVGVAAMFGLVLGSATAGYAQERGGYAGSFIRLGLGARAKGMGGAFVGAPGDIYSIYYNPAGIPDISARHATFSYRNLSLDREFYYVGFSTPLPPSAGLAAGWIHAGVDGIDGRDFSGSHTQTYVDSQDAFLFAFGVRTGKYLNIGVGGAILREGLAGIDASGFGINAGILIKPVDALHIGAAVRNIGARYSWNSESLYERGSTTADTFPAVYTVGASLRENRLCTTLVFDVSKNTKSDPEFRAGFENNYFDEVVFRGGVNGGAVTAGFGIYFPLAHSEGFLNYAFENTENDPEATQIISLDIAF